MGTGADTAKYGVLKLIRNFKLREMGLFKT